MLHNRWKPIVMICVIWLAAFCFLTWIFHTDNKYDQHQAPISKGVLDLSQVSIHENEVYSLVDNWAFYHQQYVTASSLAQAHLTSYVYLGQYPDYSMRTDASAYGVSTYHLHLSSNESRLISIYVPELDSASEIWLDDHLLSTLGDFHVTPMKPTIQNQTLSFEIHGEHDLFIIVGNDTHYYSGMYFPPLLSTPQGIYLLTAKKMIFYGFLCFTSLAIALYSLNLWIRNKRDHLLIALGIATICFAFFISKEFIKTIGISQVSLFYALIDTAYFLILYQIVNINHLLCQSNRHFYIAMKLLSIAMIVLAATSFLILPNADCLLTLYGSYVDTYKYLIGFYIIYTSYLGFKQHHSNLLLLLCANMLYMIGILYTLIFANVFEPLCYGWPNEYFSYFIVISFTAVIVQRNEAMLKENDALRVHLSELVEARTNQLEHLLNERRIMLGEFAHDLKAPVSSMHSFIELIRLEDIQVDQEIQDYLRIIEQKSEELQNRMQTLQQFSKLDQVQHHKSKLHLPSFLTAFYETNLPDCDAAGVHFQLQLCKEQLYVLIDPDQFRRALENLFYNALSFTQAQGHITILLEHVDTNALLHIKDTGSGIPLQQQANIFEKGISLRNDAQQDRGFGLYITRSIITESGGTIHVISDGVTGSDFIIKLPLY